MYLFLKMDLPFYLNVLMLTLLALENSPPFSLEYIHVNFNVDVYSRNVFKYTIAGG